MPVVPPIGKQCLTCRVDAIHRHETLVRKDNLPLGTSSFWFALLAVRRTVYLYTRLSIVHLGNVVCRSQCYLRVDGLSHRPSLLCHEFLFVQPLTMVRGVRHRSLAYWNSQRWTRIYRGGWSCSAWLLDDECARLQTKLSCLRMWALLFFTWMRLGVFIPHNRRWERKMREGKIFFFHFAMVERDQSAFSFSLRL